MKLLVYTKTYTAFRFSWFYSTKNFNCIFYHDYSKSIRIIKIYFEIYLKSACLLEKYLN